MDLEAIEQLVEETVQGERRALRTYGILKQIESELKKQIDQVKELALDEAEQYEQKDFVADGFAFTLRPGRTIWSFKHIPSWQEEQAKLKAIEESAKQAYKAMNKNMHQVTEDGEVIEPAKVSYSKPSLSVKVAS